MGKGLEFLQAAAMADTDDCILWPWCRSQNGYGKVSAYGRKGLRAHVVAFVLGHGIRPQPGQVVMHSCDTPACVNPRHLSLGTVADNQADMKRKGRGRNKYEKLTTLELRTITWLRALGLSQAGIAAAIGRSQPFVSSVIRGECV